MCLWCSLQKFGGRVFIDINQSMLETALEDVANAGTEELCVCTLLLHHSLNKIQPTKHFKQLSYSFNYTVYVRLQPL